MSLPYIFKQTWEKFYINLKIFCRLETFLACNRDILMHASPGSCSIKYIDRTFIFDTQKYIIYHNVLG